MRVKIYLDNGNFNGGYTEALLHKLCALHGVGVAQEPNQADLFLVSMNDPASLPLLKKARAESDGQPVVLGGFEGYFGEPYLAWADAVNVGEGFEFFDALGKGADWTALDCVLQKGGTASASYYIEWTKLPVVRLGSRTAYYLAGRGCHNKCAFCATSWVQPYRLNSKQAIRKAMAQAKAHDCKVTMICNDSRDIPRGGEVNAASVTIRDYLRSPGAFKSNMLHFGVEGWTEEERRRYGKPVSVDNLIRLVNVTKDYKQECELFMIAGRSGWSLDGVREFVSALPQDTEHLPAIHVKLTYFDPCPHTPLARESPATEYADIEKVFRIFNAHNKRFRVFPVRSLARSNWRTVLHRCTPEQALRLGKEPKDTNTARSRHKWLAALPDDLRRLAGAIDDQPCQRIKVRHKPEAR